MRNKTLKVWSFLFLLVGIGNFLMMIDILLSDGEQAYSILSVSTSKGISVVFYAIVSCFLIFAGIYQNRKLNKQKNDN